MAKSVTLYNVFVASPSDVKEERDSLEEVIREFNLTTANSLSIRLDLVKWETHTYPSFGEGAQDVINNQIKDDYDIFIGIMWSKFGTPTGRYDSGTQDEFERAFERWKSSNGKDLTIMFYFKNAPIMPENIDVSQIQFLKGFKAELGQRGGLYWNYTSIENFKSLLRIHLNMALTDIVNSKQVQKQSETSLPTIVEEVVENEEVGFLDNIEFAVDEFNDCWESLEKMSSYMNELTARITERTDALDRLNHGTSQSVRLRESKRLVDLVADDMINYVNRTRVELPIFKSCYEKGFMTFSEAYSVWQLYDIDSAQM